jgi:hypothetical protein
LLYTIYKKKHDYHRCRRRIIGRNDALDGKLWGTADGSVASSWEGERSTRDKKEVQVSEEELESKKDSFQEAPHKQETVRCTHPTQDCLTSSTNPFHPHTWIRNKEELCPSPSVVDSYSQKRGHTNRRPGLPHRTATSCFHNHTISRDKQTVPSVVTLYTCAGDGPHIDVHRGAEGEGPAPTENVFPCLRWQKGTGEHPSDREAHHREYHTW